MPRCSALRQSRQTETRGSASRRSLSTGSWQVVQVPQRYAAELVKKLFIGPDVGIPLKTTAQAPLNGLAQLAAYPFQRRIDAEQKVHEIGPRRQVDHGGELLSSIEQVVAHQNLGAGHGRLLSRGRRTRPCSGGILCPPGHLDPLGSFRRLV